MLITILSTRKTRIQRPHQGISRLQTAARGGFKVEARKLEHHSPPALGVGDPSMNHPKNMFQLSGFYYMAFRKELSEAHAELLQAAKNEAD